MERQTGKAVLEHRNVVIAGRLFSRMAGVAGRGERIILRRREERSVLPLGGINDPLLQEPMTAEMSIDQRGFRIRAGHRFDVRRVPSVNPKTAAVRLHVFGAMKHAQTRPVPRSPSIDHRRTRANRFGSPPTGPQLLASAAPI
jgi:hypothetical protein